VAVEPELWFPTGPDPRWACRAAEALVPWRCLPLVERTPVWADREAAPASVAATGQGVDFPVKVQGLESEAAAAGLILRRTAEFLPIPARAARGPEPTEHRQCRGYP
jgi:hypothetical protein